jgi:hypothetical protein
MADRIILPPVNVVREGHTEPLLGGQLADSSSAGKWGGIAFEKHENPAVFAPSTNIDDGRRCEDLSDEA